MKKPSSKDATPFSPREFLKTRRPEQFSDSVDESPPRLSRSELEYHLSTITSRNQETDFAEFARLLMQKEVCPNLLPQTGPVGGGDSKADSQTYPVAAPLAETWWVGVNSGAADERWAVAASAKAVWREKCRTDVRKIVGTGRGYKKVFFVTNQFVPDRKRAAEEDALRKKHRIDVRILDRTWILDRVFSGRHEELAISSLRIAVPPASLSQRRVGPNDAKRTEQMEALEKSIADAAASGLSPFLLVENCIEAALLARGLERPRAEVEGKLLRARSVAEKHGTQHQNVVAAYNQAWTAHWWFEDYAMLARVYPDVERLVQRSENPHQLELLTNLWVLLAGCVGRGALTAQEADLHSRLKALEKELKRLSSQNERPAAALQARTMLLQARLSPVSGHDPEATLAEFNDVVERAEGLVGYPFEPMAKIMVEAGVLFGASPTYLSLFEKLASASSKREGEAAAGKMWLRRGAQELAAGRPYEAIRSLGRSLRELSKDETRQEAVRALYLCARGYEEVGLLWAARGTMLHAVLLAINDLWRFEEITAGLQASLSGLKWIELQLGRVPQALAWHEVHLGIRAPLIEKQQDAFEIAKEDISFDGGLGLLLLRCDLWRLARLSTLPDVLDRLWLCNAAIALKFALGHEDPFIEAMRRDQGPSAPEDFFRQWVEQPVGHSLPAQPQFYETATAELKSIILGCSVTVETHMTPSCLEAAEMILASLESLAATAPVDGAVAREPSFHITVRRSDFASTPIAYHFEEDLGRPKLVITCSPMDLATITREQQAEISTTLISILAEALARMVILPDTTLEKLIRDERGMDRAVRFAASHSLAHKVLGKAPRLTLDDWLAFPELASYRLNREEAWDVGMVHPPATPKPRGASSETGNRRALLSGVKHSGIRALSVIRLSLWDEAKWSGVYFLTSADPAAVPIMALAFAKLEPAAKIFEGWKRDFAGEGGSKALRVSVIRGIDKKHPHWYRLVIGSEIEFGHATHEFVSSNARINTMEAQTDKNLGRFLEAFARAGKYLLAFGQLRGTGEPLLDPRFMLERDQLIIREAWQVGLGDLDSAGIQPEDDPVVPDDIKDPPVFETLEKQRSLKKKK